MKKILLLLLLSTNFAFAQPVSNDSGPTPPPPACTSFGTTSGTCAQGGVVTAGGPTGAATTVPVITYNAAGQLTAVTTASTGVTTVGTAAVGQIPGATTNATATAGNVGETTCYTLGSGSAVSPSTGVVANVTSGAFTAGQWSLSGLIEYTGGATTTITFLDSSISATSATRGTDGTLARQQASYNGTVGFVNDGVTHLLGPLTVNLNGSTNYFLVTQAGYAVSTIAIYGQLCGTRIR